MSVSRPAWDLLLACATWEASRPELERVREHSSAAVDWTEWMQLVRWHGLVPHAQRALDSAPAAVPLEVAGSLAGERLAIAAASLARAKQLAALLQALDRAGVCALPFKGTSLSLAAYGDLGVRDSIDLDVVVCPRDVDRAREVMVEAGYRSSSRMSPAQERALQRSFGHFTYTAPGAGAVVELHWRFSQPRYPWSIPPEDVLARAGTGVLAGIPVAVPDHADQLLLQAMHGARHQWERLEWLVAFAQLLKHVHGDGKQLIDRAHANGSARALGLALRLVSELLRTQVPPGLLSLAEEAAIAPLAAKVVRALKTGSASMDEPYWFNLRMMDRLRDRVRYVVLSVATPTPREWELVRLPDSLLRLYYAIRLARVLAVRPIRFARVLLDRVRVSSTGTH